MFDSGLTQFNYKQSTVSLEFILYANHVILICYFTSAYT